jgi:hypothetical protein
MASQATAVGFRHGAYFVELSFFGFLRLIMACVFNSSWFLSEHLSGPPNSQELNRSAISPAVMPEGANLSVDNKNGTAPWAGQKKSAKPTKIGRTYDQPRWFFWPRSNRESRTDWCRSLFRDLLLRR